MKQPVNQAVDSLTDAGAVSAVSASPSAAAPHWSPPSDSGATPQRARVAASASAGELSLSDAVARVNSALAAHGHTLQLSVDEGTQQRVILVRDTMTGAVIRKVPGDDVLRMARALESGQRLDVLLDLKA